MKDNQQNEESKLEQAGIKYGKEKGKNTYSFYNNELDMENAFLDGAKSEAAKEYWQSLTTPASKPTVEEGQTQEPVGGMGLPWISANNPPKKNGYYICWLTDDEQGVIHYHVDTGWQNGFYNDMVTHYMLLTPPDESTPPPAPIKKIVNEDMICPETNKHCDDECCTVGSECNISGENIQSNCGAPIKTEGEDEIKQEFKELRTYIEDLYHGAGVNMQIWIELSDKMNAFERKVLAGYSASLPQSSTEEENQLWIDAFRDIKADLKIKELKLKYKISKR